jgi:hypothetical protein
LIFRFHHFGGETHPNLLRAKDIERYFSSLATVGKGFPPRPRDNSKGPVFLYQDVLKNLWSEKLSRSTASVMLKPPAPFSIKEQIDKTGQI